MDNKSPRIHFTISIVVYKPDMEILAREFSALKIAFVTAQQKLPVFFDIYVIDNTETNDYQETLESALSHAFLGMKDVTFSFIKSDKNLGYGYGNNLVIKKVNSNYHLVINPDVFVAEDAFLIAIDYLESHPEVGLLIPAIFGEDGQRHYLCKQNPTLFDMFLRSFCPRILKKIFNKRLLKFEMRDLDYAKKIANIPYPSGCFMLFRTPILKQIDGFDEKFFMYVEDADIGRRVLSVSSSIYLPEVKIIHRWSRKTHSEMKFRWITVKSVLTYWWKYGGVV